MELGRFKPFYINLTGFRVTVFGGGSVGTRRARYFLEAGARVRVVAREFTEELRRLEGSVELLEADLRGNESLIEELISESDLVVVATSDPELNRVINDKARSMGKLVNNATEALKGNVIVPFSGEVYDGMLKVAVTSLGLSGIAARRARDKIVEVLEADRELRTIFESMMLLKDALKTCVESAKSRFPVYFAIEGDENYKRAVAKGDLRASLEAGVRVVGRILGEDVASCMRMRLEKVMGGTRLV